MADGLSYSPLKSEDQEIRLLRLHHDLLFDDKDVRCHLFTASLKDEDLRYDALSYCWGDPQPRKQVFINGQSVGIGPELEAALRHFRRTMPGLIIWADAICINQRDDQERSEQVRQMGKIYSKAQHVQVWLGVAGEGIHFPPLNVLKDLPEFYLLHWVHAEESNTHGSLQCSAFFDFISRPYWNRLWIVQELALAQKAVIHYGGQTITMDRYGASSLQEKIAHVYHRWYPLQSSLRSSYSSGMLATLSSLPNLRQRLNSETQLSTQLVADIAGRQASDARDKIFALQALSDDFDAGYDFVRPDYSKTVEEVYTDFARYAVKNRDDLYTLLRLSGLQTDQSRVLSSWTPDWRQVYYGPEGSYKHRRAYRVHGTCDDRTGLHIQARLLDEVQEVLNVPGLLHTQPETLSQRLSAHQAFVGQFLRTPSDQDNKQGRLRSLFNLITTWPPRRPLQPGTFEHSGKLAAFFRVLIKPMSTLELTVDVRRTYVHRIGAELLGDPDASTEQIEQLQAEKTQARETQTPFLKASPTFGRRVIGDVNDSRLFITRSGEMGFGSPKLRPGNGVYSLKPGRALFALRKEGGGNGEEWYINAGECYMPSLDSTVQGESEESEYMNIEIR